MKKKPEKETKTPSAPPKRRASSRAKSADGDIPESSSIRDEHHKTRTPVVEIAPSMPPAVNRIINHTTRRARAAKIVGGELPDAFIVDFLVNFLADHRSDTGAERIPCGEVTGVDGITEEIQARFVPKLGPGYYRITPRVNGKITKGQWVEYVSASGHTADEINFDDSDDDLLEESSTDDSSEIIRLRERLRYEQKLREAQGHNSNGHNPIVDKLLERVLAEKLNDDPVEKVIATFEAVEKIKETVRPHRESNPTPAPPPVDPKIAALKIVAENPEIREIAKDVFGLKRESDSDPWADLFNKLLDHPQLPTIVQSVSGMVVSGLSGLASMFAPRPAQAPAPQQQPQAQPPQTAQTAPQVAPADAQALPAPDQQKNVQAAPEIDSNGDPYVDMLTRVITMMANNAPIEDAVKTVNGFLLLSPQYADAIDAQFGMDAETLLGGIGTIPGCESIPNLPHAKGWIERFQRQFFDEESGEDSPADSANGTASVVH